MKEVRVNVKNQELITCLGKKKLNCLSAFPYSAAANKKTTFEKEGGFHNYIHA